MVDEYVPAVDFRTLSPGKYPGESLVEVSTAIPAEILPALQSQISGAMTHVRVPYLPDVSGFGSKTGAGAEWA